MKMIVTADWHIRATRPRCRVDDDWMGTQRKALNQILEISRNEDARIMVVGDLFHANSDVSFECIRMIQELADFADGIYVLAGNHDLPYHSSENIDKSAIGVLMKSDKVFKIEDFDSDYSASNFDEEDDLNAKVVFKHVLTIPEEDKPGYVECETPETLLKRFPKAKWIFTGDYHRNFHYERDGRHVVNSGCLLRQASDLKSYQCGVYYVDTDEEVVEFIPILDSEQLIDDSYITKENERGRRIEEFVDKLKNTESVSFDFVENVKKSMEINQFDDDLKNTIDELMEV